VRGARYGKRSTEPGFQEADSPGCAAGAASVVEGAQASLNCAELGAALGRLGADKASVRDRAGRAKQAYLVPHDFLDGIARGRQPLAGIDVLGILGDGLDQRLGEGLVQHRGHVDLRNAVLDGLDLGLLLDPR